LAQALLHDPEVLILDEPTTGLDPNQLDEIRGLIKKIGVEKTVMLSPHIMQEVEAICDRVIIINKGQIVANEKVEQMSQLFSKSLQFTIEYSGEMSKAQIMKIDGVIAAKNIKNNRWLVDCEDGKEIRNELFQLAVKADLSVLSLQEEQTKLEDIFKQLTLGKAEV
jgi:ABC-2 type transport system ATP-binding protein